MGMRGVSISGTIININDLYIDFLKKQKTNEQSSYFSDKWIKDLMISESELHCCLSVWTLPQIVFIFIPIFLSFQLLVWENTFTGWWNKKKLKFFNHFKKKNEDLDTPIKLINSKICIFPFVCLTVEWYFYRKLENLF